MSQPLPLFDAAVSLQEKQRGMSLAIQSKSELLEYARAVAVKLSQRYGEVTADDVNEELAAEGITFLGCAAGSLFRSKEFYFTGRWRKSTRVSNHARMNRIWALRRSE